MPAALRTRLACLALGLCIAAEAAHAGEVHHYRVELDAALSRLEVQARFGASVAGVTARSRDAGEVLAEAWECGATAPIRMRNQRMLLPVGGVRCMNYTVDLAAAARQHAANRMLAPGNVLVSPSLWLWRPPLDDDDVIDVQFVLPEGVQVSVPWQPVAGEPYRYLLRSSPESADAPAVFGDFARRAVAVPGAVLDVAVLRPREPARGGVDVSQVVDWVQAAATDVTLAYGRFPNPSTQVVVIPVEGRRGGSAVPWGEVVRDGGESVELYVDESRSLRALLGDWTATHEFSHLMLPYLVREHRWVSEGFAQYYQNVLLARSGAYDAERAWQELYAGFERGRLSRPELSPNDAAERGIRTARMKIYWSGAALALMADVRLREASGGQQTLDTVLERFQACCLPSRRVWTAPELFAKLDALAGQAVFVPLYRRYADAAGFPDPRPLLARLGVDSDGRTVRLRRDGALAPLRFAITAADPAAARAREQLAASQGAPGPHAPGSR